MKMPTLRTFAALIAAGMGASAFAEVVDVGGGALEKNRSAEVVQGTRPVVEPFALGQRTFDRGWEFRLKDYAVNFNKVGIGAGGNNNGITTVLGETNGWRRVDIPHDWMLTMPVAQSGRNGFRAVGRNHPANSVGWYIAEGGRQPWIVVGLQKTAEAVSPNITGGEVWLTMIGFTVIYLLLAIAALYAALRFIRRTNVTQAEGRNG